MALTWTTFLEGGPQKVNHAAALVGQYIYSFGGYSTQEYSRIGSPIDVYVLCTVTNRWRRLDTPTDPKELQCVPFQRYGHTAVAHGTNIYIWGGKNDDTACNHVYCFDTVLQKWSCPKVEGDVPSARDGHAACIVNDKMYIIGGFTDEFTQYADGLYALDLKTMRWSYIIAEGEEPPFRDFHSAVVVDGKIYVFGGRGGVNGPYYTRKETYNNDLYIYDPKTMCWTKKKSVKSPPGRRSLGMVPYGNRIYIFGGYDGHRRIYYNDVHYYDTIAEEWSGEVKTYGSAPCKRRRHCTVIVDDRVFIFGGTSPTVDLDTATMRRIQSDMEQFEDGINFFDDSFLKDYHDMYILDLKPTLRTLCMVTTIKHKLNINCLPKTLQTDIMWMTTHNQINMQIIE